VPGLGKTLLVKSLAQATDMQFRRVQFTPDLMPSDIVGTEILEEDQATRQRVFRFQQGPVFTQVLLADEINRAPPKTQSALLEAMQERSVTFAGQTHKLPKPFFVLATQNPIEQAGTYPLPEAQLDRFLLRIDVGYPTEEEEIAMVSRHHPRRPARCRAGDGRWRRCCACSSWCATSRSASIMLRYATRLVRATRPASRRSPAIRKHIGWGAGPRAGQALVLASKARALMHGRLAVTREDIAAMLLPVLAHRVLRNFEAEADGIAIADILLALRDDPSGSTKLLCNRLRHGKCRAGAHDGPTKDLELVIRHVLAGLATASMPAASAAPASSSPNTGPMRPGTSGAASTGS
jgi:MoxR-like ATPase